MYNWKSSEAAANTALIRVCLYSLQVNLCSFAGSLQYSTAPGSAQCHRSALASQLALTYHMCASGSAVASGTHHLELMSLE